MLCQNSGRFIKKEDFVRNISWFTKLHNKGFLNAAIFAVLIISKYA